MLNVIKGSGTQCTDLTLATLRVHAGKWLQSSYSTRLYNIAYSVKTDNECAKNISLH